MISKDRYEPVIAKVVEALQKELGDALLGIILGGSVARGTALDRSDLDFYVVQRPSWRQRRLFRVDGVAVELFINPAHQARQDLEHPDHISTTRIFGQGRILFDSQGLMQSLVLEARRRLATPRPAAEREHLERLRYDATDFLHDTLDLLDVDEDAASYLVALTLEKALEAHYRIQQLYPVKPKNLLGDLRQHSPDLEPRIRRILSTKSTARSRAFWLGELVQEILAPVGGLISEWETTRQDVIPAARPGSER